MIHSMCGGGLKDNEILSFAKVTFDNNPLAENRPYWYKNSVRGLKAGDKVLAPFGRDGKDFVATVVRVDIASEQTPPLPLSRMGTITIKAENT